MPSFPRTTWRLLIDPPQDGATNMAIDEAITEAVRSGDTLPTLRFYQWTPACLSLGRMQAAATVDFVRCAARGWDVVRRSSGGRAVLHEHELTYSVIARDDEPRVAGGIMQSYQHLSDGLLNGLLRLGLTPDQTLTRPSRDAEKGPICFDVPAAYEITHGGRKLVGSAQKRSRDIVLQHGAIPLRGDVSRIVDALAMDAEERELERARVSSLATTIEAELGTEIGTQAVIRHLVGGFAEVLNIGFVSAELTPQEHTRAQTIRSEKYANPLWTNRK